MGGVYPGWWGWVGTGRAIPGYYQIPSQGPYLVISSLRPYLRPNEGYFRYFMRFLRWVSEWVYIDLRIDLRIDQI